MPVCISLYTGKYLVDGVVAELTCKGRRESVFVVARTGSPSVALIT